MANPHPTKSKPNKIGRKHVQGERQHQKARRERGQIIEKKIKYAKYQKKIGLIKKYWEGEIETYPK